MSPKQSEKKESELNAHSVGGDEFETLLRAWAAKAPDRVAPLLDRQAWDEALKRRPASVILHAGLTYLSKSHDVERGLVRALRNFLSQQLYDAWCPAHSGTELPAAPAPWPPEWRGPPIVWDVVADLMGEAFACSWLAPCGWDNERNLVLTGIKLRFEKLHREPRIIAAFRELGIGVELGNRTLADGCRSWRGSESGATRR